LNFKNVLAKFQIGFIIVRTRTNALEDFLPLFPEILAAALSVRAGEILHIGETRRGRQ